MGISSALVFETIKRANISFLFQFIRSAIVLYSYLIAVATLDSGKILTILLVCSGAYHAPCSAAAMAAAVATATDPLATGSMIQAIQILARAYLALITMIVPRLG